MSSKGRKNDALSCAQETAKYLASIGAESGVSIYADNKRFHILPTGELAVDSTAAPADPKQYLEYCGDFMSMSFEGPLYDIFNYWSDENSNEIIKKIDAIFEKYGKYKDFGNAWNLSLYDL